VKTATVAPVESFLDIPVKYVVFSILSGIGAHESQSPANFASLDQGKVENWDLFWGIRDGPGPQQCNSLEYGTFSNTNFSSFLPKVNFLFQEKAISSIKFD